VTSPRRDHLGRNGFSLIELTLAMAMVAMLAMSLYSAFRVVTMARRSTSAAVEQTRAVSIASDILRQDFESVPPPTGQLAGAFIGTHQPGGTGDRDSIEFYSIASDPVPVDATPEDELPLAEGIRRVELYLTSDATSPALVRRITRNLLPTMEAQAEEEIICRHVRSFSVRYFDGTAWQESWDSTTVGDVLPTAVAITLELDDPSNPTPQTTSTRKITRVFNLSCAKPVDPLAGMGGQL
jgi:prepilin-type N-terminal cleavage/methylation domain-containing protein